VAIVSAENRREQGNSFIDSSLAQIYRQSIDRAAVKSVQPASHAAVVQRSGAREENDLFDREPVAFKAAAIGL
jgi:hypothetical protein